jgi:hypothetical protein
LTITRSPYRHPSCQPPLYPPFTLNTASSIHSSAPTTSRAGSGRASPPHGIASRHMTSYPWDRTSKMVTNEPNCPFLHSPCRQATQPSGRTGETGRCTDTRMGNSNASARYSSERSGVGIEVCDACGKGPCCYRRTLVTPDDAAGRRPENLGTFHLLLPHPYGFVPASYLRGLGVTNKGHFTSISVAQHVFLSLVCGQRSTIFSRMLVDRADGVFAPLNTHRSPISLNLQGVALLNLKSQSGFASCHSQTPPSPSSILRFLFLLRL